MSSRKIAVIGAGFIHTYHCQSLRELCNEFPGYSLDTICDLSDQRARLARDRFGFAEYVTSLDQLLERDDIYAASVLVPPSAMLDTALKLFERGIHCILEKPPGKNPAEVAQLAQAAGEKNIKVVVALNRRFIPLMARLKKIISGLEHQPGLIEAKMFRHRRSEPEFAYGTGVHVIDAMCFLMGRVKELEVLKYRQKGNLADSYLVDFKYENGAAGKLKILPECGYNIEHYEVHGAEFSARLEAPLDGMVDYPGKLSIYKSWGDFAVQDNRCLPPLLQEAFRISGFLDENRHFIEVLEGRSRSISTLDECLHSMLVAQSVLEGASASFS